MSDSRSRSKSPPPRKRSNSNGRDDDRRKDSPKRSDSRGRSASRSRSPDDRRGDDDDENKSWETMALEHNDDVAFILGKGGTTKRKIARVCGAELDLQTGDLKIEMYGTRSQREKARHYLGLVVQQRKGGVYVDPHDERSDRTIMDVPEDCVAFVMGRQGQTLRQIEDEWGSLMCFAKDGGGRSTSKEKLLIFGSVRARRGSELKVMSALEHKKPGYCVDLQRKELYEVDRLKGDEDPDGWGLDQMWLVSDDFSYALGAQGSTRKKLALASGSILEYVGKLACIAGFKKERRRGLDYLKWLLKQKNGSLSVEWKSRDDVDAVEVPSETVGFVTGHKGESLRAIERETNTFCFTNTSERGGRHETLLIFGHDSHDRRAAKDLVEDKISDHKRGGGRRGGGGGYDDRGGGGRYDDRGGGGRGRSRSRSRSRSRDRRRDRSDSRDRGRDRRSRS